MARRGRPPLGASHVERLDSSPETKKRLEAIVRTLGGELSVTEASEQLGLSEAHFHRLRERALAGAVEALEPRPAGRPAEETDPTDARVAELEQTIERLELELLASQVREEIAMVLPHVVRAPATDPKKRKRVRRRRRHK